MVPYLIEIHEKDVAEKPPTSAEAKFSYDPSVNVGVLQDGIFTISIYGQNMEAVMRGLIAYSALRAAPTSGDYNFQEVKQAAWALLKQHLSGMKYGPKET
jgi:hypothetical protein